MIPVSIITKITETLRSHENNNIILNAYSSCSSQESEDPNIVKVAFDNSSKALFFTRKNILTGYDRTIPCSYKQLGIYGYSLHSLEKFSNLSRSILEDIERIELMRWIDYGHTVNMIKSGLPSYSVDTIEDLAKVESLMKKGVNISN